MCKVNLCIFWFRRLCRKDKQPLMAELYMVKIWIENSFHSTYCSPTFYPCLDNYKVEKVIHIKSSSWRKFFFTFFPIKLTEIWRKGKENKSKKACEYSFSIPSIFFTHKSIFMFVWAWNTIKGPVCLYGNWINRYL